MGGLAATTIPGNGGHRNSGFQVSGRVVALSSGHQLAEEPGSGRGGALHGSSRPPSAPSADGSRPQPRCRHGQFVHQGSVAGRAEATWPSSSSASERSGGNLGASAASRWGSIHSSASVDAVAERSAQLIENVPHG